MAKLWCLIRCPSQRREMSQYLELHIVPDILVNILLHSLGSWRDVKSNGDRILLSQKVERAQSSPHCNFTESTAVRNKKETNTIRKCKICPESSIISGEVVTGSRPPRRLSKAHQVQKKSTSYKKYKIEKGNKTNLWQAAPFSGCGCWKQSVEVRPRIDWITG